MLGNASERITPWPRAEGNPDLGASVNLSLVYRRKGWYTPVLAMLNFPATVWVAPHRRLDAVELNFPLGEEPKGSYRIRIRLGR